MVLHQIDSLQHCSLRIVEAMQPRIEVNATVFHQRDMLLVNAALTHQMLADNPCRYDMYPDCRDFMCGAPVEWDDTKVLSAKLGEYYVVAKRSGDEWYIAGLNNSTARDVTVDLSFLGNGRKWTMSSFTDGPVADRIAMDYRYNESEVDAAQSITIHMTRNGGFAAKLK